jgi:hypothetical protein
MEISIKRLREYIENDKMYQEYKKLDSEPGVYERFHYVLCSDIENVLDELDRLRDKVKE